MLTSPPIPDVVTKQYFVDRCGEALFNQGMMLAEGNLPKAMKCFEKAASYGCGLAMGRLGAHYHNKQDYQQACIWHQQAAAKGVTRNMFLLGLLYQEGKFVTQNYKKAVECFKDAIDIGEAALVLGDLYSTGTSVGANDVKRDDKAAFESYKRAAELGNVEGMFEFARRLHEGTGTKKDPKEAVYWYQQAADKDHVDSMLKLSQCAMTGDRVKKSQPKAFDWCKKAADVQPANGKAKLELGHMYAKGSGVKQDIPEAVKCYKEAITAGVAEANAELEKLLENAKRFNNDTNLIALMDIEAERICKITDIAEQKRAVVEIGAKCFQILTAPKEFKEDGKAQSKVDECRNRARLLNTQLAGMSAKNYSVIYAAIILASITSIEELSAFGFLQNAAKLQAGFANSQETLQHLRLWDREGNLSILADANKGRTTTMTRQLLSTLGYR